MTELLIDGQRVVLPPDFSFTLYEENPFFTKNGQYTYDLTLSLKNFNNSRIYEHIDRPSIEMGIQPNRKAVLKVDNEIKVNGTEIILGFGDSEVKIQLASGNSELNFLIGGDKKLRSLDLGKASPYTGEWRELAKNVYLDLDKTYPERNWILAPYSAGYDTAINKIPELLVIGNRYVLPNYHQMEPLPVTSDALPQFEPDYSGQVPQPFLCFIIREVVEALGYTLEYNVLEDDPVRKLFYIVHGYRTFDFAKMLPNWTVKEFFDELEMWLDAVTVVDEATKTIRLLYRYQSSEFTERYDLNVMDEFNVDPDENDSEKRVQTANVAYDLDDDDYYFYMCIKDFVRNGEHMPLGSLDELIQRIEDNPDDLFKYIYDVNSRSDNSEFIAFKKDTEITLKKIDSFKPLMNNSDDQESIDINLKIVPASFVSTYIQTAPSSTEVTSDFWIQIPVAENYDELIKSGISGPSQEEPAVNQIDNVQEAIESDTEDNEKGGTRLRLAIYAGLKSLTRKRLGGTSPIIFTASYPMPFVEALYEDIPDSKLERYMSAGGYRSNPFRLADMNEEIYKKNESIDTSEPYKFSFELKNDFDIRASFVIRNRLFACSKIEKEVTADGFGKYALGYFYPKEQKKEA
ncbi:MAG: hypothetical protein ACK5KL_11895 [Dysgonomonas sp.]